DLRAHPQRVVLLRGPLQALLGAIPAASPGPSIPDIPRAPRRLSRDAPTPDPRCARAGVPCGRRDRTQVPRRRPTEGDAGPPARPHRRLLPAVRGGAVSGGRRAQAMTGHGDRAILFASEYYPPFAPGGAEWTNAAWAAALARQGHRVVVVTPNYGAARRERAAGVDVVRVPFPFKRASGQREVPRLVHQNPIWDLYFAACVVCVAYSEDARVIHAQGKGALVASWIAARMLGRPVLATVRDLGLVCPLGLCTL